MEYIKVYHKDVQAAPLTNRTTATKRSSAPSASSSSSANTIAESIAGSQHLHEQAQQSHERDEDQRSETTYLDDAQKSAASLIVANSNSMSLELLEQLHSIKNKMVTMNQTKLTEMDHNRLFYERLRSLRSPDDTGNETGGNNAVSTANSLASVLNQHAVAGQRPAPGVGAAAGNTAGNTAWGADTRSPLGEVIEEHERIKLITHAKQQQQALQFIQQQQAHVQQQKQQQQHFLNAVALRNLTAANHSTAAASLGGFTHAHAHATIQPTTATPAAPSPATLQAQLLDSYNNVQVPTTKDLDVIEINSSDSEKEDTGNGKDDDPTKKKNKNVGKKKDSLENSASSSNNNNNKRKSPSSSVSAEKDDSLSSTKKHRKIRSASLDNNDVLFEKVGSGDLSSSLQGPFVRGILSNNEAEWDKITLQSTGKCDDENIDEQSIRIATSKILYLATITKQSKNADGSADANAANDKNSSVKSTPVGNKNDSKAKENNSKNTAAAVTSKDPQLHLKDAITVSLSDVETIAKNFVEERKKTSKDTAKKFVRIALAEMTQRHEAIVAKLQAHIKSISNNTASQVQGQHGNNNNDNNFASNRKQDGGQNTMRKREHKRIVAKLEERHKDQLQKLQMEQERFIIELQKKHQRQMDKLRSQNDGEKLIHSRALNSYLTASCDALRLMKDSYFEKDI